MPSKQANNIGAFIMKALLFLFFAVLVVSCITGCANITEPIAKVNDDALLASETVLCRGISVGAWIRAYGNDKEKASAWKTLCNQPISTTPAK
jgi:hypothetical protein